MKQEEIGTYKDYTIYGSLGGWLAKSEKYQQTYGDSCRGDTTSMIRAATRQLEKAYASQEWDGYEKLRLK